MTIYELDDILDLKDADKIIDELQLRGFRRADTQKIWEFDHKSIREDCAYHRSAIQTDKLNNKDYCGTLYTNGNKYKGLTFITLFILKVKQNDGYVSIPTKAFLFTDAPYNEEYVTEMNSPCECHKCKKSYIKKELIKDENQLLCENCFADKADEEIRLFKMTTFSRFQEIINNTQSQRPI